MPKSHLESIAFPEIIGELEKAWPVDLPGRAAALTHLRALAPVPHTTASETESASITALQIDLQQPESRAEKRKILDSLCFWATPAALTALRAITEETWAQDRASSIYAAFWPARREPWRAGCIGSLTR